MTSEAVAMPQETAERFEWVREEMRTLPTQYQRVVLGDGAEWCVHELRTYQLRDAGLLKKYQHVLSAIPVRGESGEVTTTLERRRERMLGPLRSRESRLTRLFDLQLDMAERVGDAPGDQVDNYMSAVAKAEKVQEELANVMNRIAGIEKEAERDKEKADEYAFDLLTYTLRLAYPRLESLGDEWLRDLIMASDETLVNATFAMYGLKPEREDPKKEGEDRKQPSNASSEKKSNGA